MNAREPALASVSILVSFSGHEAPPETTHISDQPILCLSKPSWQSFVEQWAGKGDEDFFAELEEGHDVVEHCPASFDDEDM